MQAVITQEMAIKAYLHGACRLPEIGRKIASLPASELIWAEDRNITQPEEIGSDLLIWALSGYGYGYGYGYSYGYGYGSGYGYGYGYGYGSGDGYGDGDGDGDGDGYGYGYGYGDGDGSGYGDGYGFKAIEDLLCK